MYFQKIKDHFALGVCLTSILAPCEQNECLFSKTTCHYLKLLKIPSHFGRFCTILKVFYYESWPFTYHYRSERSSFDLLPSLSSYVPSKSLTYWRLLNITNSSNHRPWRHLSINRLFNGWFLGFLVLNGISTFVCYLIPKSFL